MAPPTFLGGEPAAMPAQFWDSATGEENLVVAVAPPVSVRAVSARLPRATSRFVCVEAAQPELSVAALDVKPVAFIGPESAVVALCTRPGPIRFAIAVGSSTEPRTLAARLAATNPDILVTALPSTLSAEETVQKAAAFVADAVEAMGVWAALYGSRNVVGLDGIANLRDFGGYPTRDGKRVRRGVMYRSADLSPAPESSFHALHWELGVSHIHDLRSNPELAKKPYDVPEKLALGGKVIRYHTPVNKEEDYSPEALALRFGLYSSGPLGFAEVYPKMAHRAHPVLLRLVSRFLLPSEFSPNPPNFLIHCTAGKDRTGILACLILAFLGVPDDLVARDYGASESLLMEGVDAETRGKEWMENVGVPVLGLKEHEWEEKGREMWENMKSTKPIAMLKTIHALRVQYGPCLEGYYKEVLGLDAADQAKLREELLEDGDQILKETVGAKL